MRHQPLPVERLKSLRRPVRNVKIEHQEKLTRLEKLAVFVTERIGTMGFFLIIFLWTVLWIGWNTLAPVSLQFDPYPAFVLWLFLSNLIQILLMPLIMVGQNLQGRHADARAESDFEVNVKAEREIETVLLHLENQTELLLQIVRRLENRQQPAPIT
jgi:uncharacterized membrane protein